MPAAQFLLKTEQVLWYLEGRDLGDPSQLVFAEGLGTLHFL